MRTSKTDTPPIKTNNGCRARNDRGAGATKSVQKFGDRTAISTKSTMHIRMAYWCMACPIFCNWYWLAMDTARKRLWYDVGRQVALSNATDKMVHPGTRFIAFLLRTLSLGWQRDPYIVPTTTGDYCYHVSKSIVADIVYGWITGIERVSPRLLQK